ncbi:MAG: hypothetical protein E7590_09480 [Ruminococcaceae bacterium]|nr:hypothetical protein [Oscillospiraceae bacterium]
MGFADFLLILLLILIYTGQSFFCKLYTKRYPGDPDATTPVFSVVSGFVTALAAFVYALCRLPLQPWNWQIIVMGIANSVVLAVYNYAMVKASESGPYSVQMSLMLSGGILVPGVIAYAYGTGLEAFRWIFVAVIVVSVFMVSKKKGESFFSGNRKFWIFCAILFVFNGLYGSILAHQGQYEPTKLLQNELIICTFGMSGLINFVLGLCKRKKKFFADFKQSKFSLLFLLLASLCTASAIILLSTLINNDKVHTTVLFTFDNAGVLFFSVVCSAIFLKEKLSVLNWIGCGIMAIGLIGIAMPWPLW